MRPIRAFLMLALPLLLPFGAAQAAPYDATATEGGLQVVCKDFTINSALLLSAKCNTQGDDGTLSLTDVSYNIGAHFAYVCSDQSQRIDVTADSVKLVLTCHMPRPSGTADQRVDTINLNDRLSWDPKTGWALWNS